MCLGELEATHWALYGERSVLCQPFNSQNWLACIFSLKYQYFVQQTGDENTHLSAGQC